MSTTPMEPRRPDGAPDPAALTPTQMARAVEIAQASLDGHAWAFHGDNLALVAHALTTATARLAEVDKQLDRERNAHLATIEERDRAQEMANDLADAVVALATGGDPLDIIGEHTSANCPWTRAKELADKAGDNVENLEARLAQAQHDLTAARARIEALEAAVKEYVEAEVKLHLAYEAGEGKDSASLMPAGSVSAPLCGRRLTEDGYRMTINVPLARACQACQRVWRARHAR